mgnify:CR=1 FL=1
MTFDSLESSLESGQAVEVYDIQQGSTFYRYTSSLEAITVGGIVYEPLSIARGPRADGPEERSSALEIVMPGDNIFVKRYIFVAPSDVAILTITKVHRGDNDPRVTFVGRIQAVAFSEDNRNATLNIVPLAGSSARPIPRHTFSGICDNVLYDGKCTIAEALFRHTDTVSGISADQRTISVANLAAKGADWAVPGFVSFDGERRLILAQSGDSISLNLRFTTDPTGAIVVVQAGCDKLATTCKSKFNNLPNFSGFPFVPKKNPFEGLL